MDAIHCRSGLYNALGHPVPANPEEGEAPSVSPRISRNLIHSEGLAAPFWEAAAGGKSAGGSGRRQGCSKRQRLGAFWGALIGSIGRAKATVKLLRNLPPIIRREMRALLDSLPRTVALFIGPMEWFIDIEATGRAERVCGDQAMPQAGRKRKTFPSPRLRARMCPSMVRCRESLSDSSETVGTPFL